MSKQVIKIDVISDVVCPWCYIGKRRLEKAMQRLSSEYDFDVQYHPFELNPGMPVHGENNKEYLVEKFGSVDRYELLTSQTTRVAAQEELSFDFNKQRIIPNTRKAHALIQFAGQFKKQSELTDAFFRAYFSDGINLSDDENLLDISQNIGLDKEQARVIIADVKQLKRIEQRERTWQTFGIRGVPFYIINDQYGISGAQTTETFIRALKEGDKKTEVAEACDVDKENC
jgi:predicted DsbA family dithiol-disulfide isomerase